MRNVIRKWLGMPPLDDDRSVPTPTYGDVLAGSELAMMAYRIDNGYLLRFGGGIGLSSALMYCTDEKDMAEKIVAHRAKLKLGVKSSLSVRSTPYNGNYAADEHQASAKF